METNGISRFPRLEFPSMLRVYDSAVLLIACHIAMLHIAFPLTPQGRRTKVRISELHSWPACTHNRCYTHDVAVVSVRIKADANG